MANHAEAIHQPIAPRAAEHGGAVAQHQHRGQQLNATARLLNASAPVVAQRMLGRHLSGRVLQRVPVVQLMDVDATDIGKNFNIVLLDRSNAVGTLQAIKGGGWYEFKVGGNTVNVRGKDNIVSRAGGGAPVVGGNYYSSAFLPTTDNEFDVDALAKLHGITPREVLMRIRNSFREDPRTLRVHYPFGSKTVAKGNEAFRTPDESEKEPQAMVSYRKKDYGKHKKVGKDYDEWANELSDSSEDEDDKQARAENLSKYLKGEEDMDTDEYGPSQKAALGGLLSVGLISDPLRTEFNTDRTETDFFDQLDERAQGNTSFHEMFGSKKTSTFLPARKEGSSEQRKELRAQTEKELRAVPALFQNNCLINAICRAAHNRNATLIELMSIRFNLANVGAMMVASQASINAIRNVLGINNPITVRYPVGTPALNENFAGVGNVLNIYHTGMAHFQHTAPHGVVYQ
jgi:hypothetical protein